ncbi:MAG: redoxin domain-containing protein [Bacteroidales bacterium]|nr:redoxin domain-containing protein [Bacteroidales bacterium]
MKTKNRIYRTPLYFFIIALSFSQTAFCQYDIKLEISNAKNDTIFLGYYYMGATYAIDTCVNKKGKFQFQSKDKKLEDGIYFFSNNAGSFSEFIISDSRKMTFKTKGEDWNKYMTVKGSEDEKVYLDYLQKSNVFTEQFKNLSNQTQDKVLYNQKLSALKMQSDSLKEDFISKYPQHFLSKVLNASRPIVFPKFENIYKADGTIDSLAMQKVGWQYYKQHYFDNIDLSCSGLIRTPKEIFHNTFNNFWDNVMKYEKTDTIIKYADSLILACKNSYEMEKYFINDIARRYLLDNVMGHDKIYVHMIDKYFKTGKVAWMHPSDIEMNITRADKWRNLLIGKIVPNLSCPEDDEKSKWHSLSDLQNRYKILVFWSVECGHCSVEMPKLAEWYKNNKDRYNAEIFAVHSEGDINEMHAFAKKNNMSWINVNGLYANYDWHTYFDIEKTPVIYILNKENKILAKNISVERIGDLIEFLEKGEFEL